MLLSYNIFILQEKVYNIVVIVVVFSFGQALRTRGMQKTHLHIVLQETIMVHYIYMYVYVFILLYIQMYFYKT